MSDQSSPDLAAFLRDTLPFSVLTREHREDLLAHSKTRAIADSETILEKGEIRPEHIFAVLEGSVALLEPDTEQTFDVCVTGDVFGIFAVIFGEPLPYQAVARGSGLLAVFSADAFADVLNSDERFRHFFEEDLRRYFQPPELESDILQSHFLFGTRVGSLLTRPPVMCSPDVSIVEAVRKMRQEDVGSIVIVEGNKPIGIVTTTDLRDKVVAEAADPHVPVRSIMSAPVISIPAGATVFDALLMMTRRRLHHLVVTESAEGVVLVGVVSATDLARGYGQNPAAIIKLMQRASDVDELASLREQSTRNIISLHEQGVRARELLEVITEVNDELTARLLLLAERHVRSETGLKPPSEWEWMLLGSEGRREQSLKTDQDNAIIFSNQASEDEKDFLRALAERVNKDLAYCGYELCPGDVMARNPRWRLSLTDWKRTFFGWMIDPDPKALMHASIFFDLRSLSGNGLVARLKQALVDQIELERGFLSFLLRNALDHTPPLTFFRRFAVEMKGSHSGAFDIKKRGLMPLTGVARVLALNARYLESTSTFDRLEHVVRTSPELKNTAENALEAFTYLTEIRLAHHLEALVEGRELDNHINPNALTDMQRKMLRDVFSSVATVQEALAHRFGASMIRS